MKSKLCPRWPGCQCITQGYVNRNEDNDCGRKPRVELREGPFHSAVLELPQGYRHQLPWFESVSLLARTIAQWRMLYNTRMLYKLRATRKSPPEWPDYRFPGSRP